MTRTDLATPRAGPPIVYVDQPDRKGHVLLFDADRGGHLATQHLIDHGCEQIGTPLVAEVDEFTIEAGAAGLGQRPRWWGPDRRGHSPQLVGGGIVVRVRITFEFADDPCPWGGRQPTFGHLAFESPDRYFLVGRDASGNLIRVQLAAGHYSAAESED